nr:TOPRIM nucleotidyl transferase/hydrolase domain-containing protein [Rhizobium sp. L43]
MDQRTWRYSFEFYDTRRNKPIGDINSLSAGQKAIIHLVLEAYGRGELKGGVVIIDEPEIHLHYQFQHEYLQVLRELNRTQNCQYILVTHSESLINSSTISSVRRFALDANGHTSIFSPTLSADEKSLIRILDNSRSTYAFFSKKVVLVEGDTDRYFFRALLQERHRLLEQEIAVLHVGGKRELPKWHSLFSSFGLRVYAISDFDYIVNLRYPADNGVLLRTAEQIAAFKQSHLDWEGHIDASAADGMFVLREGDLETYLDIRKDLSHVIEFCQNGLQLFLADDNSSKSREIRSIIDAIAE